MKTKVNALATLFLALIVTVLAACSNYVPPQTGLPSRQNWLNGGGG